MKAKYLSCAQAYAMCRDYQHLCGEVLEKGYTIELVAVVPYSHILQWQYLKDLLNKSKTPNKCSPENPAGRYDVLLISRDAGTERGFIATDLRSYLAARGMPFDAARYACLRNNHIPADVLSQILS